MLTKLLLMPKFLCPVHSDQHFSLGTECVTLDGDWSACRNFESSPDTLAAPYIV